LERKYAVKFDSIQQRKGLFEIHLALPGKADNDVGGNTDLPSRGFHPGNPLQVLLAGVEPLHYVKHAGRTALYGKMYMIAKGWHGIDGLDDVAPEVTGMRGGETYAADPWNLAHCRQ